MWAIFIAIFGGLFLAMQLGSDRSASRQADIRLDQHRRCLADWRSMVVDRELETHIETNLIVPETANVLKKNTLELIRSFHGLEEANFNYYYNAKYKDYYVRALITYVELVRVGKLPSLEYGEIPNYIELAIDLTPSKRARVEFCRWVENTMRENGVSSAKLFYTGESYASFSWAPYVFDPSKAISVNDPNIEKKMRGISTEETDARNSVIIRSRRQ